MATAGKTVVRPGGKRGVLASGKAAVFDSEGQCPACCCGFEEGTTLEYHYLHWDVQYRGTPPNCQVVLVELQGVKENVVLEPLWTEQDQTDCGVWEGIGQHADGYSDADNPYELENVYNDVPVHMQIRWNELVGKWETRQRWSPGVGWGNWYMLPGIGEDEHVERSDSGGYLMSIDVSCSGHDGEPGPGRSRKYRKIEEITVVPPLP